jgi:hypothetical protein
MTPSRSSECSRCVSSVVDIRGHPRWISLNVWQPRCRLRTMRGVHRSARISAPLAIGQYCW